MTINAGTLTFITFTIISGAFIGYKMNSNNTIASFYVVAGQTGTQTVISGFQCNCINLGGSHLWQGGSGSCSNQAAIQLAVTNPPTITPGACCQKTTGTIKSPSINGTLIFNNNQADPCLP